MKNKKVRRITAALLTMVLAVSLTACGGSGGSGSDSGKGEIASGISGAGMPEVTVRDGVVRSEQVIVADPSFTMDGLQLMTMEDGWFYGIQYVYDDEGDGGESINLVRFRSDGTDLEEIKIQGEDSGAEIVGSAFRDGCFYLGLVNYENSPALDYYLENEGTTEELEIPEDLSEDAMSTFKILCLTAEGETKWSVPVDPSAAEDEYYYITGIEVLEDGVYVSSGDRVDKYSKEDGSFVENVCSVSEEDMVGSFYVLRDGTIIMSDEYSTSLKINEYDKSKQKFVEKSVLPSSLQGAVLFPGRTNDLYISGEDGIYSLNLDTSELKAVLNFVNSDMDTQGVVRFMEIEDGKYAIETYGNDTSVEIYLLDPVDPKDVKEKKELTLGGYYIDYQVRSEVISFNKESDEYRISLVDYSKYDTDEDDYYNSTGMSQMNTDIASGAAPDILLLSEEIPVDSYISKGVFADLTDWYNTDSEIDSSDFLENVIDAFKTDGKMYLAVPGFGISGVIGKKKYIGDGKDLSIDQVRKIAADKGIKESNIFGLTERDTIFHSAIEFSGDEFIDRDSHTCDFNNQNFQKLLEFVKLFPDTFNEEDFDEYFTQYLADRALLYIQNINSIFDYNYLTRDLFGDTEVTITGFPSDNNKGPAVVSSLAIGINSSASDPEGCWSFVRRFYLPEFQMKMDSSLPVSEKAIDAQGEEFIRSMREQEEEFLKYQEEMNEMEEAGDASDSITEVVTEGSEELPDAGEAADGEAEILEGATDGAAVLEESEDMSGIPIPEEDFDGTHEEYEAYVKAFEEELAASGGTVEAEVIGEGTLLSDEDMGYGNYNLPNFNEDDMKTFKELIKGLHYSVLEGSEEWSIISEEADAFFAGQKSVSEVVDIIQSRVQVYLKENE